MEGRRTRGDGGPAVKATKRDRIVAELRRMIQAGEIPRGARVQQDALAELFATSITPVREALRLLEAEGLLVGEPHRGVRVADADADAIKAIYLQRRLLEPYAMKRAVRRLSPRDLDQAVRLLDTMESLHRSGNDKLVPTSNREFHFLFYDHCGNDGLRAQIDLLWQQWPWDLLGVIGDRASSAPAEHREILKAARAGDADRVAAATEAHLVGSYLDLASHLSGVAQTADPFEIDVD